MAKDVDVAEEAVETSKDETGSETESSGFLASVFVTSSFLAVTCFIHEKILCMNIFSLP